MAVYARFKDSLGSWKYAKVSKGRCMVLIVSTPALPQGASPPLRFAPLPGVRIRGPGRRRTTPIHRFILAKTGSQVKHKRATANREKTRS